MIRTSENGNQAQIDHLLGVVDRNRDERCENLRAQARSQAQRILQQAHADARAHMHEHVVALREKHRQRIAAAHARNATWLRLQHQQTSRALIERAWPLLRAALVSRWSNAACRQSWVEAALESATHTQLLKEWRIEHPPSWPQAEIEPVRQRILALTGKQPMIVAYDDIDAGLRFICDGTTVDASVNGLLQLHARIKAQLLARMEPVGNGAGLAAIEPADG